MATGWMKSLHCKSKAVDDVVDRRHHHHKSTSKNHHHSSLSHTTSCRNSVQNLKDIVETTKNAKPKKQKPPHAPPFKRPVSRRPEPAVKDPLHTIRTRPVGSGSFFPSLTELPSGHPSRNVVEIIFHTSWGEKDLSGRVEMVFKVQNLARTVDRFEEYRQLVKHRASCGAMRDGGEDHARCVADGNEVMRFYCLGAATSDGAYGSWAFHGGKMAAVCTFSGSSVAHENAGGGVGRRAMLVCRVIAGRVCKQLGYESLVKGRVGCDSVSGDDGELLVFDARALLPCFLIIYKL